MLTCISKKFIHLYTYKYADLLNNKCRINKKDLYLHYLNKIYLKNTEKKC